MDFIQRIIELSEQFILWLGYPGLTIALFLETFFPPIPAQVLIPLAGVLVSQGEMNFVVTLIAGVMGETLGSVALYFLGQRVGEKHIRRLIARYPKWSPMTAAQLDSTRLQFQRYGNIMVVLARIIQMPTIRTLVSLVAGISGMNLMAFTLLTVLGSSLSVGGLVFLGWYLGDNWQAAFLEITQQPWLWITGGVLIIAAIVAYRRFVFARRNRIAHELHTPTEQPRAEESTP